MNLPIRVLGDLFGPDAVAPLHLVGIGDLLAGEHARVRAEASDLVGEPAPALRLEIRGCEVGCETVRVGHELLRLDHRLGGDGLCELRRAVVGVDAAVDVASEAEPEEQVALDGVRHTGSVIDVRRATSTRTAGATSVP